MEVSKLWLCVCCHFSRTSWEIYIFCKSTNNTTSIKSVLYYESIILVLHLICNVKVSQNDKQQFFFCVWSSLLHSCVFLINNRKYNRKIHTCVCILFLFSVINLCLCYYSLLQINLKNHEFGFGSVVSESHILDKKYSTGYQNIFYEFFNWATVGSYKWKYNRGTFVSPDNMLLKFRVGRWQKIFRYVT